MPVRLLVRVVVADHSERSLTSALPPIGDLESVVCDVPNRVVRFGPLQRYLDDPEVGDMWVDQAGDRPARESGRAPVSMLHTVDCDHG